MRTQNRPKQGSRRQSSNLGQQVHLFSDYRHGGFYLLPVGRDQLVFFILELLVQLITLPFQLLLFCITAVIKVVLGDVAVSAGRAPDRCP